MESAACHVEISERQLSEWDQRFLDLARLVAGWSKDPSTKVGCVLSRHKRVLSMGFNGPPSGWRDSYWQDKRARKLGVSLHAEDNALLFAQTALHGATAYVTHMPCSRCYTKLCQAGISRIIYYADEEMEARWDKARQILREIIEVEGRGRPLLVRVTQS